MFTIGYAVYLFGIATFLAFLEIQIAGKDGWAKNLPCWRPKPDSAAAKIYSLFMGGKELTGYHAVMFFLPLAILHFPFVAGIKWTLVRELEVFSNYFLLAVFWDFLWFVWNPQYGLKKFKPQFIGWHKKWLGRIPADYPMGIVISFIIAGFGEKSALWEWAITLGLFGALTLISCLISLFIGKYR